MPRQAHRKERRATQEIARRVNRFGSCKLRGGDALAKRVHAGLVIERLDFAITRQKKSRYQERPATKGERSAGRFWGGSDSQARWRAFLKNWRRFTRRDRRVGCSGAGHKLRIMRMTTEPDYYISTFETGQRPHPWRWELRRRSHPMGVTVGRSGYQSQTAAEYAGKRALELFLEALANEERRGQ